VNVVETDLPGVLIVEPDVFHDSRGFFFETYHGVKYRQHGIADVFVQDNHSRSGQRTVRGLHLQAGLRPQAKLVRVVLGEVFDVAVDVRRGSPTFGKCTCVTLSASNFRQCYVPAGFAHGFAVTSEVAEVEYKCSEVYDPASELGIAWNDPALAIPWPVTDPILSDRDRRNPLLAAVANRLPEFSPQRPPHNS
jgi:dTDP-4-dehydrorhamnose 3,5-epimerase